MSRVVFLQRPQPLLIIMQNNVRVRVLVSGKVQGVFLRHNIKEQAKMLRLKGWVKNLPDGKVEAVVEGEKEIIETIIKWVRQGPFLSRVDSIKVDWQEARGEFDDFQILY